MRGLGLAPALSVGCADVSSLSDRQDSPGSRKRPSVAVAALKCGTGALGAGDGAGDSGGWVHYCWVPFARAQNFALKIRELCSGVADVEGLH